MSVYDLRCRLDQGMPCSCRLPLPKFNKDTRELYLGDAFIHRFSTQASNQIAVLTAFQDAGWPREIPDPLGNPRDRGFGKRLHDTSYGLSRVQKLRLIRFSSTACDRKIRWDLTALAVKKYGRGKNGGR
jgi:hypothetical protein